MVRPVPRFALGALVLLTGGIFVGSAVAADLDDDPRNGSNEYWDAVNGANCMMHHQEKGFRPGAVRLIEGYRELPIGEVYPVKLRLHHNSRMAQQIQQMAVVVDTSAAPNVDVIHEDHVEDLDRRWSETLTVGDAPHKEQVEVDDRAHELYLDVRIVDEPFGTALDMPQGELKVEVRAPGGRVLSGVEQGPFSASLRLEGDRLRDAGTGAFQFTTVWDSEYDEEMEVAFTLMVNHTREETAFMFRAPPDLRLSPGEQHDFEIPIRLNAPGLGTLDFRVQSISYWEHNGNDGAGRDDGLFYRFVTMRVSDGDEALIVTSSAAPQPTGPAADLYHLFTRILGFSAALLLPAALVTGGVFGKRSRRWLNKVTGGAKKRVLWHSAMSWMIIVVASSHLLLALLETNFIWTKGLLWGGVGWVLLVSLGFTGYYQTRMIKRWDYRVWRRTHLASALAVVGFVMVHMLLDGSDLAVVREALPHWVERLSWP